MKRKGKKLISLLLSMAMILTCVPSAGTTVLADDFGVEMEGVRQPLLAGVVGGVGEKLVSVERLERAPGEAEPAITTTYVNGTKVIRGVIDSLADLPQANDSGWENNTYGTAKRPFFILEIVPYEEMAHAGYLVSGCEPIAVEDVYNIEKVSQITNIGSLWAEYGYYNATNVVAKQHFEVFPDEPLAKKYSKPTDDRYEVKYESQYTYFFHCAVGTDPTGSTYRFYYGYYEYVGIGNGTFNIVNNGGTCEMVKESGGCFEWNTLSSGDVVDGIYLGHGFEDPITDMSYDLGDRIYSKRMLTIGDTIYWYPSITRYKGSDSFLKYTFGMSEAEAEQFSVLIKTITPSQLTANTDWIKYADLISIAAHTNEDTFNKNLWNDYNVLNKKITEEHSYGANAYNLPGNDISAEAALMIFEKATSEKNHAGILMPRQVFQNIDATSGKGKVYCFSSDLSKKYQSPSEYSELYPQNMKKLSMMLTTYDPQFFKQTFLNKDNPIIKLEDGKLKNTSQVGDCIENWNVDMFKLIPDEWAQNNPYWIFGYGGSDIGFCAINSINHYIRGHVYVFNNTYSPIWGLLKDDINSNEYGYECNKDFWDFCKEQEPPIDITKVSNAFILKYILGVLSDKFGADTTLRILDLEPSVSLDVDGNHVWLTPDNFYDMFSDRFEGTIEVTNMTTNEFVGRIEDLCSEYDLIYIGSDVRGFNLSAGGTTDFNDNSMDGKIYFHVGDLVLSTEQTDSSKNRDYSVKFYSGADNTLRFGGNDITSHKLDELNSFVKSGKPVVVADDLTLTNTSGTYLAQFLDINKDDLCSFTSTDGIDDIAEKLENSVIDVTFTQLPSIYQGMTGPLGTASSYLPERKLPFGISVGDDAEYRYVIYTDKDRNSKYASDEIVFSGNFTGSTTVEVEIGPEWFGSINWKIDVFRAGNEHLKVVEEGCSVLNPGTVKKPINVLQICSGNNGFRGDIHLNDSQYANFFKVPGYDITIDEVTWDEFSALFEGENFKYNVNTKTVDADIVESVELLQHQTKMSMSLGEYNMIIVGFGDTYGAKDIDNDNGAVEYLEYYVDCGKSVLFTHDLTSIYNTKYNDVPIFGYTANTMLRDIMGLNRYGIISERLRNMRQGLFDELSSYQSSQKYDTALWNVGNNGKQGFTYFAIKKLAYHKTNNENIAKGYKLPFSALSVGSSTVKNTYRFKTDNVTYDGGDYKLDSFFTASNGGVFQTEKCPGREEKACIVLKTTDYIEFTTTDTSDYVTIQGYRATGDNSTIMLTKKSGGSFNKYPGGSKLIDQSNNRASLKIKNLPAGTYRIVCDKTVWLYEVTVKTPVKLTGGFNNDTEITDVVSQVNKGQITQYPYALKQGGFTVAETHAQWYQANVEDPELTVWYCLDGGENNVYSASPNDVANNYYIYSKGNVFYSGVGHSSGPSGLGDDEIMLFVNTMIAAYRQVQSPPKIVPTAAETSGTNTAGTTDKKQTADVRKSGKNQYNVDIPKPDSLDGYVRIYFVPSDTNLENNLFVKIGNTSYTVDKVYNVDTIIDIYGSTHSPDTEFAVNVEGYIPNLCNEQTYYFYYPLNKVDGSALDFTVYSASNPDKKGTGKLIITLQSLYDLD